MGHMCSTTLHMVVSCFVCLRRKLLLSLLHRHLLRRMDMAVEEDAVSTLRSVSVGWQVPASFAEGTKEPGL